MRYGPESYLKSFNRTTAHFDRPINETKDRIINHVKDKLKAEQESTKAKMIDPRKRKFVKGIYKSIDPQFTDIDMEFFEKKYRPPREPAYGKDQSKRERKRIIRAGDKAVEKLPIRDQITRDKVPRAKAQNTAIRTISREKERKHIKAAGDRAVRDAKRENWNILTVKEAKDIRDKAEFRQGMKINHAKFQGQDLRSAMEARRLQDGRYLVKSLDPQFADMLVSADINIQPIIKSYAGMPLADPNFFSH